MKRRHLLLAAWPLPALAHDFRVGAIVIEHPYALPSAAGSRDTVVHFRALLNRGRAADRLVAAHCAEAATAQLRQAVLQDGVRRWVPVAAIALPPGQALASRHDGEWQIAVGGFKAPLAAGDEFALRLQFEHAGSREVTVTVQAPRR
ncbi:copper chaperone PCu(A)C [Ideonella sp. DXS22W]|uniref:Copper chaperone PCu(A)C n=1 Tax=Pseudaquabacterium inlustre TaxID=2984192 RepID=A0ABU9CBV4_9BURK